LETIVRNGRFGKSGGREKGKGKVIMKRGGDWFGVGAATMLQLTRWTM